MYHVLVTGTRDIQLFNPSNMNLLSSSPRYGVCTKTGRVPCYSKFFNGSAAGIPMYGVRVPTPGCYPDQICCQTGTPTGGPKAECISKRMGYDLKPSAAASLT